MAEEVELEIPARPEFLAVARLVVSAAAANEPTFSEERIDDLRLAVSEAATNAIEEQRRTNRVDGGDVGVTIRCTVDNGQVEVEVGDKGAGFDPDRLVPHPEVTDLARLDHERGLGIPLIRLLTDEVEFRPSPHGTVVRMVVHAFPDGGA